jgi:hypothetical protein
MKRKVAEGWDGGKKESYLCLTCSVRVRRESVVAKDREMRKGSAERARQAQAAAGLVDPVSLFPAEMFRHASPWSLHDHIIPTPHSSSSPLLARFTYVGKRRGLEALRDLAWLV